MWSLATAFLVVTCGARANVISRVPICMIIHDFGDLDDNVNSRTNTCVKMLDRCISSDVRSKFDQRFRLKKN
jgi:hypothetical protein